MGEKKDRVTVRLTTWQTLVLKEMSENFDTSISLLIRTIVGSWLTEHEDDVYRAIDNKRKKDIENVTNNKQDTTEA